MPSRKTLKSCQDQLQKVKELAEELSHKQYSQKDVHKLQQKLHHIDAQYKEGIIDDRNVNDPTDDPYEHEGQAQLAEDLSATHEMLTRMLANTD
ncbi:hypothetical protein G6F70_003675 [Rhizopus microsporus]|uniref:Tubulin-specific chaperone A n=2 Tax=Rhizopus TaxID=4842 RepID=A0A367KDJ2_RHIAZ|nr:hypothetical protein G6F71_003668 [Rhizopus microsporus]RCI00285.1 hypothetical protein CU097_012699 [Rhizopus azygosporus]KAG1200862.1 hypothetical protein G6F70_003675 [Rhizopus microsporus]KAG1212703.1 hypothetical protein G6F69_003472 [Rhizopus microsporus]KAG1234767.1 hypothetical protein G6F67_003275 [Rhizopus microsporus]